MIELNQIQHHLILHFNLFTCNSLLERSLGKFVDEKKAQLLKDKCLPVEGCAVVAGRTDKGVTALQQVCSFCMLKYHNLLLPSFF